MKIDFSKVPIENIEGNTEYHDARKIVGNTIFNMADNVDEHDLGIKIYHAEEGELELSQEECEILRKYLAIFKYNLRSSLYDKLPK